MKGSAQPRTALHASDVGASITGSDRASVMLGTSVQPTALVGITEYQADIAPRSCPIMCGIAHEGGFARVVAPSLSSHSNMCLPVESLL